MNRTTVAALLLGAATAPGCAYGDAATGHRDAPPPDAVVSAVPGADTLSTAERALSGGRIYFVGERAGQRRLHRVLPVGGSPEPLTVGPWNEFPSALSPDRRALLVVASHDTMGAHFERIGVLEQGAIAARPLTAWTGRSRNPSWSSDGRWVVVESDRESFGDLYRLPVTGSAEPRRLTRSKHGSFEPATSPDGREIAFVASREGNADIYVMQPNGRAERRLTASPRDSWAPAWSPDGRWIAFLSSREGRDRAYLVRRDGTDLRPLLPAVQGDTLAAAAEGALAWSPDGRTIALIRAPRGGNARLWVVPAQGGAPRAITPAGTSAGEASWSPDGRYIAYSLGRPDEPASLWIARADGSSPTRIVSGTMSAWLPRWGR